MMNKCILTYIFVCIATLVSAQIRGKVIDSKSYDAIQGAEILNLTSGASIYTEDDGSFELPSNITKANFIIFKSGYTHLEYTFDEESLYEIKLDKLEVELSEIELIEQRKEIFATRKLKDIEGTSIYAGKKSEVIVLDLIQGNLASNVSRQVYAQISGLNIYEGSDGGLQLNIGGRGLDPNRTSNFNTRQNGYDISADILGYPENYYTPPAEALEEIKILRGASSLQYGTQFGGLIDFKIRKIPKHKTWDIRTKQTYGSFNLFNTYNAIGYNTKSFSINGYYNYKRGDGYRSNSEFNAHNAFTNARYFISTQTQVDLEFTYYKYLAKQAGGLTDLQFQTDPRQSTRTRNWFAVDWKLYNLKFNHTFSKDATLELNVFGLNASRKTVGYRGNPIALNENPITSIDEQDINGQYINPRDLIDGRFKNFGAEIRYLHSYKLARLNGTYLIGAKYYNSDNTSIQGPGSTSTDANFSLQSSTFPAYSNQSEFDFPNLNYAAFIENIFYINEKLTVTPGIRMEYIKTQSSGTYQEVVFDLAGNPIANNSLKEEKNFPRSFALFGVGLDYTIADQTKFSMNLSQNYRSVTFSDIRVVNPTFIIDENITDENGLSFSSGISGRYKSRLSYDFNVYSILYNDRIGIIIDERANRKRTNIGDAFIAGTESLINYIPLQVVRNNEKLWQVSTFINSSFTYSRYLNSLSNNVTDNKVEFIPSANIKAGITLTYKNINTSVQYSYISKQFTDAQNSAIANSGDFRSGIIGEIPAYQIMDIGMQYRHKSFTFDAGINNVLDQSYFTRRATGYPGPGIIPSDGRSFYLTLGYIFQK